MQAPTCKQINPHLYKNLKKYYNKVMTIAGRNRTRLVSIFIMLATTLFAIAIGGIIFFKNAPVSYSNFENNFFKGFLLTRYESSTVFIAVILLSVLSTIFLIYIYITFKKTHALEISFFVAFIFSMGFECLRIIFPLYDVSGITVENISFLSRAIYFSRLAAIFSLFIGSVFSLKILTRQIYYVLFFIFFLAFLLTISMPISNINMNKFFLFGDNGSYSYQFILGIGSFTSCLNYFIASNMKNSKEYFKVAIGTTILIIGYWILVYTSSYLFLGVGLALFIIGTLKYIKNIHNYHLWE